MTVVTVSSEADVDTAGTCTLSTAAPDTVTHGADAGADAGAAVADPRHARALAALRSAEARTGVRKQATAARAVQAVRAASSRVQVRALPGGLASGPAAAPTAPGPVTPTSRTAPASDGRAGSPGPGQDPHVLPVHPYLAALLPDGGLRTGTTVVVRGSTSLLLTLLAEASRGGAWTVLVGYPAAGMAAAADAGCDLARTLVVPLPAGSGVDAPTVLAALIDGMDVVVVGPQVALLEQDRRRLTARARDRGSVLVPAGREARSDAWAGAHVVLEATEGTWAGIDGGAGWLRHRTLRVRRTGRGSAARPLYLDVEVPVCRTVGGTGSVAGEDGAPGSGDTRPTGPEGRPRLGLVG